MAPASGSTKRRSRRKSNNGSSRASETTLPPVADRASPQAADTRITPADLRDLLAGLRDLRDGDFTVRLAESSHPLMADIATAFNDVAGRNERMTRELERISDIVGRQGNMTARVSLEGMTGGW